MLLVDASVRWAELSSSPVEVSLDVRRLLSGLQTAVPFKELWHLHTYSSENGAEICARLTSPNLTSLASVKMFFRSTWRQGLTHTKWLSWFSLSHVCQRIKVPVNSVLQMSGLCAEVWRGWGWDQVKVTTETTTAAAEESIRFANIRKHWVLHVSWKSVENKSCVSANMVNTLYSTIYTHTHKHTHTHTHTQSTSTYLSYHYTMA